MAKTSSIGLEGNVYNRWLVVAYSHKKLPHHYYLCRCECGNEAVVQANSLKTGISKSCGCHRREVASEIHKKHGLCDHPAYQSWVAMRRRCFDPMFSGYESYGGTGITVCEKWQTFEGFWDDMAATWAPGLSIDRINNHGNYEPGNCRWATDIEQANNKRNNHVLNTPWGKLSMADAARKAGLSRSALKHRVERNWPESRLFEPMRSDS